jgi:hypothetical protein
MGAWYDAPFYGCKLRNNKITNFRRCSLRKETLRMYTEEEVRLELENVFAALPPCVQVVFANQRCQACGQVCTELYFYSVKCLKTVI